MSNETDVDVVEEYQSFPSYDRQKMEERKREERRGWMITWTGVVVILLVTALITIALSANDEPADLAAGGAQNYRVVTTFTFKPPGAPAVGSKSESFVDPGADIRRVVVTAPANSGQTTTLEFITSGSDAYIKFGGAYPAPEGVPAEMEWIVLDQSDPRFVSLAQGNETSGALNGAGLEPFGYLDSLPAETEIEELRSEDLRGTSTTLNRVSVNTIDYFTSLGQADIGEIVAAQIGETMTFDVWIDGDGVLHRWRFSRDFQGTKVEILSEFFINETVDVTLPDDSTVYDGRATEPASSPSAQPSDVAPPQQPGTTQTSRSSPSAQPSESSVTFRCTSEQVGGEEQEVDC